MTTFSLTYVIFNGEKVTEDFDVRVIEAEADDMYDAISDVNQALSAAYLATRTGSYCLMEVHEGATLVDVISDLDQLQWIIDLAAGRV